MKVLPVLLFLIFSISSCETYESLGPSDIQNGFLPSKDGLGNEESYNVVERMNFYKIPGASIALVENGEIKWAKGYGIANSQDGNKVDVNTRFQAASISKPLASLVALKLVDENLVELDADVNTYLKNWKVPENKYTETEKVTLRRLLTHTSGVNVHGFGGYESNKSLPSTTEVLNGEGNSFKVDVKSIPGTAWKYSGGGYTVAQKLVEDMTEMPFEKYADTQVLKAIGMNNSTFEQLLETDKFDNVSAAYNKRGKLVKGLWHNYPEKAAAGLWTTPTDLAQYCIEIQNILKGKTDGVLTKEIVEQMLIKDKGDWGLGLSIQGEGNSLVFRHDGKNKGFTNEMIAFANTGNALIIMTNADNGGQLIREIMDVVSNQYEWDMSR